MVAYRIGIDVGGTFTDFVAVPDGGSPLLRHKVASTPADPSQAVEEGMRTLLAEIGAGNTISSVTHGMTIGLNAIIQRRGGRVVLVVTEGFPDLLEIGRSRMPSSFDLHAVNQRPLVSRDHVLQVSARLDATGNPEADHDDGPDALEMLWRISNQFSAEWAYTSAAASARMRAASRGSFDDWDEDND